MISAVKMVLSNYAMFTGRATRTEFWWWALALVIVGWACWGLDFALFQGSTILTTIFSLAILIPNLAVTVRRLHDTGRSGWWYLIVFIPIIGLIVLIVFAIQPSEPGDNQYGPPPPLPA